MFVVGFIELVDVVPFRVDACLAGALFAALGDRAVLLVAAVFDLVLVAFFPGIGRLEVSADGAATWVRLAAAADTSTAGTTGEGIAFAEAFLAADLWLPGLAAAALRDPARLATRRVAAGGVAGWVATPAGAGGVVLDPNAAWMVANAPSSVSRRVSTVTFMRCSWGPGRMARSDHNV